MFATLSATWLKTSRPTPSFAAASSSISPSTRRRLSISSIKGDTIAEIGRPGLNAPEGAAVIDARHRLMHPGLINAHTHGPGNLAKGLRSLVARAAADREPVGRHRPQPRGQISLGDDRRGRDGAEGLHRGLRSRSRIPAAVGRGPVGDGAGLRGGRHALRAGADGGRPLLLRGHPRPDGRACRRPCRRRSRASSWPPWKTTTKQMKKALQKWPSEKVHLALAPTIPHHCSDAFLLSCRDLAKEYDVGLHTHVAESKLQVIAGYQRYGTSLDRPYGRARRWSDRFTVAHGVWLDDDDMKRLGDRGASVAHNPGSNMRLGNGLADVRGMLDAQGQCRRSAPTAPAARTTRTSTRRCGSPPSPPRCRGPTRPLDHHRGGAAGHDRRRRPGARPRQADRQDRAGLQGRHRLPRPASHQLDPDERSGEPDRPYRGRQRRAFGDGRRPHGRREPQAADRRSAQARRPGRRVTGAPRRADGRCQEALRPAGEGGRHASARASPRRRCTSTASARATTIH